MEEDSPAKPLAGFGGADGESSEKGKKIAGAAMILGQPQPGSAAQVVPGISAQLPLGKGPQAQS